MPFLGGSCELKAATAHQSDPARIVELLGAEASMAGIHET
jgi:hypothetical protein